MKKILIIFIGILSFMATGCGRGSIDEITFKDYQKMMDSQETFILFIGSHACSHCAEYRITLDKVIKKYNVHFKYIDVANLSDEEYDSLSNDIIFDGTPTTVFINEGKETSCNVFSCDGNKRIDGAYSYEKVIEVLKNQGYIKE